MSINGSGARGRDVTVPFFIDGQERIAGRTFDVISPATGAVVHRCSACSVADAVAAADAAAEAFKTWRKMNPAQRRDIFFRAADIMDKRADELAGYMREETGAAKPWRDFNLTTSANILRDAAGRIATIEGKYLTLIKPETNAVVMREPYGVVLALAPWNAPYILAVRAVASPMAAGNTVVLKATEKAPRCMSVIASIFHEAGLPKGVLNVITHEPGAAAGITSALIANSHIKKINFTGTTAVGRLIGKQAGEHLKPLVLELGGKAPVIVWKDADLDLAAKECAVGSFLHSGQICMCTERILVHESVKQEFVEKLKAAIEHVFPSTAEAPILINKEAVERNKNLVRDATRKGASVVFGDVSAKEARDTMLRPIVVDNVTADMDMYATESFGTTVSITGIRSDEEAIRIANDTEYGLSSAVFTQDLRQGLRFAREIETGAVHINGMSVHDDPALPHGGAKASGYGRFNSSSIMDEWTRTKNVTFGV